MSQPLIRMDLGTHGLPFVMDLHRHDIAPAVARTLAQAARNRAGVTGRAEWAEAAGDLQALAEGQAAGPSWWTPEQVAEVLGYTSRHVRRLLESGDLAGTRRGRSWRVDPASVRRHVRPGDI